MFSFFNFCILGMYPSASSIYTHLVIRKGQKLSLLIKIVKNISVFFLKNIVKCQAMVTEQGLFAVIISFPNF